MQRIQKLLAASGLASRREIERMIEAGRIHINGRLAKTGEPISGDERISLDGKPVRLRAAPVVASDHEHLVYYKPAGIITTRKDPENRKTVFDCVDRPRRGRWVCVGRLDVSTSGLLLLTTDGELAHRLMHPSQEIIRGYAARILGELDDTHIAQLRDGVVLDDGMARFRSIQHSGGTGANNWYDVTLAEGRNREVRRLFEAVGMQVSRLIRTRYGPIILDRMRRGMSRALLPSERKALYREAGLGQARASKEKL